jgi:phosphatidylinositol glycan class M
MPEPKSSSKITLMVISFAIRMVLVAVADYVDRTSPTAKYTDTDYLVFSDAATAVYKGGSPYERHTYRYTPLVAYICLVNNYIHPVAAKIIWCICDILVGLMMWRFIEIVKPGSDNGSIKYYVGSWLLSPLILALSTRGSNDNLIAFMVFVAFYFLLKKQYVLSGFFYGLSVHFKIYPIIYSIVLYFYIDCD